MFNNILPIIAVRPKLTAETLPVWAKAYLDIFTCREFNFDIERQFNEDNSKKGPHCSICALLKPRLIVSIVIYFIVYCSVSQLAVP